MAPQPLVFIGQTGSGKTTVASALADCLHLPFISTGAIARQLAEDAEVAQELHSGGWAPELAIRMEVVAQIEAAIAWHGSYVMEGFPRKLEQLVLLEQQPGPQPQYFLLAVADLVCIRRLAERGRADDHPDAVATRMRHYWEETVPVIDVLNGAKALQQWDGEQPIDDVVQQIERSLG